MSAEKLEAEYVGAKNVATAKLKAVFLKRYNEKRHLQGRGAVDSVPSAQIETVLELLVDTLIEIGRALEEREAARLD